MPILPGAAIESSVPIRLTLTAMCGSDRARTSVGQSQTVSERLNGAGTRELLCSAPFHSLIGTICGRDVVRGRPASRQLMINWSQLAMRRLICLSAVALTLHLHGDPGAVAQEIVPANISSGSSVKQSLGLSPSRKSSALPVPLPRFHLSAGRPPEESPTASDILDAVEGLCRFTVQHQDHTGAVIDPFLKREHQYATPYFAFAVGTLMHFDRGSDLWPAGIRAMEHATTCFAGGSDAIPDRHGEFFIAPLAGALEHYQPHVSEAQYGEWVARMENPVTNVMQNQHGRLNNWRTYGMKGEWIRVQMGLIDRKSVDDFIADAWLRRTQRDRIMSDRWNFYQDWSSDPQSHAVEAVGRGNLLALIDAGYDGPWSEQISQAVERGTTASLLWQDASGQCPANGRTDNHVFNDVLYQLTFEVMAERMWKAGRRDLAGRFRRAADLSFRSIERWARRDGLWGGSYYVTKNHFDPRERVGYQPASQYTNYNGAVMYHLAECALVRQSKIPTAAAPVEVGGYVVEADPTFGSVSAAVAGVQMQINLRGDTVAKYGRFWSPLGAVRFSKLNWDSRLGPSDGAYDKRTQRGVTCGPTWKHRNRWVRLAEMAEHYRGTVHVQFIHPLLVRFDVLYHSITGSGGPAFTQRFVITPDGIMTSLRCHEPREFGLTLPVLSSDGRPYRRHVARRMITVQSRPVSDESGTQRPDMAQHFIAASKAARWKEQEAVLSTYGWLHPVRLTTSEPEVQVFIYPWVEGSLPAQRVADTWTDNGAVIQSELARVEPTMYVGRTLAGGLGQTLDLDSDGTPEVEFSAPCQFIVRRHHEQILAVEADRAVEMTVAHQSLAGGRDTKTQIPAGNLVKTVRLAPYTVWQAELAESEQN